MGALRGQLTQSLQEAYKAQKEAEEKALLSLHIFKSVVAHKTIACAFVSAACSRRTEMANCHGRESD